MTFATRDQYRHVVERIAKRTGREEPAVAREAVALSAGAAEERARHVGYHLLDEGLPALERATRYRPPASARLLRWATRHPNVVFVGGVLLGTILAQAALLLARRPSARPGLAAGDPPGAAPGQRHRRDHRQPAAHGVPAAAARAQARSRRRRARRAPDRGGGAHALRRRRGGRGGAGAPRGAVPRQPRGPPSVRHPERLHRRRVRDPPGRCGDRGGGRRGHRGAERAVRGRRARGRSRSSTAPGSGTRARACGWAGSGSGGSSRSSTGS